jgi:hypothetical protein
MVRFYKVLSLCTATRTNNPLIAPEVPLTLQHIKRGHRIIPNSVDHIIPHIKCIGRVKESAIRIKENDEREVRGEIIKS